MARVRVQNRDGRWLRKDRTWTNRRGEARVFSSIPDAEDELKRVMLDWLGQAMFDMSDG